MQLLFIGPTALLFVLSLVGIAMLAALIAFFASYGYRRYRRAQLHRLLLSIRGDDIDEALGFEGMGADASSGSGASHVAGAPSGRRALGFINDSLDVSSNRGVAAGRGVRGGGAARQFFGGLRANAGDLRRANRQEMAPLLDDEEEDDLDIFGNRSSVRLQEQDSVESESHRMGPVAPGPEEDDSNPLPLDDEPQSTVEAKERQPRVQKVPQAKDSVLTDASVEAPSTSHRQTQQDAPSSVESKQAGSKQGGRSALVGARAGASGDTDNEHLRVSSPKKHEKHGPAKPNKKPPPPSKSKGKPKKPSLFKPARLQQNPEDLDEDDEPILTLTDDVLGE